VALPRPGRHDGGRAAGPVCAWKKSGEKIMRKYAINTVKL
jgi:hypothetical protein